MGTAASFENPIAAELDGPSPKLTAEELVRRKKHRREIQKLVAASLTIDEIILLTYVHAGSVPAEIGVAFAICCILSVTTYVVMSEIGFNERFKDHHFAVPQAISGFLFMLGFIYFAPEVGVMFICNVFVVFSFCSVRSTPAQTALVWSVAAVGLTGFLLLTDKQIGMPYGSDLERFATISMFILALGRCMFMGIFSSSLRRSLYANSLKLREAYKRIEELAELDELTGSFNRRCIMRILDEEIERVRRTNKPCSIALIDLDWFKRINDTYGHPTGDEVLRTFAISVFANIRAIDKFGRYGGEEFLLILPDTPDDEATRSLDRLRLIVSDLDWSAFAPGMQVTLSAGVAGLRPEETADSVLARADRALYTAKARGRDRIVNADSIISAPIERKTLATIAG